MEKLADLVNRLKIVDNLPSTFCETARLYPQMPVYSQGQFDANESNKRTWKSENYRAVSEKVFKLANFLEKNGVKKGDVVALLSNTRPEWLIADLAILSLGASCASIYHSVNRAETGYILFDCGAKVVIAENESQVLKLLSLLEQEIAIPEVRDRRAMTVRLKLDLIISFEEVAEHPNVVLIREIFSDPSLAITQPRAISEITREDIASIVYTSGTTGPPKGVIQTHGNHLTNLWQAAETNLFAPTGDILLYLPLAHSFARLIGYIGFMTPTRLKFPAIVDKRASVLDPEALMVDLREADANVIPTVPRLLEKMQSGILEKELAQGLSGFIVKLAIRPALKLYALKKSGKNISLFVTLLYFLTTPLRKMIKGQLFGRNFSHLISGGAPLSKTVAEFFDALQIEICEGYGLTETCVAVSVNPLHQQKLGSVGKLLSGVEIGIAEDGELLFRGANIAKGYLNRPSDTKDAWDERGWFHTGDLGELDGDGYLYITGRKKELIVTAGGKKIPPQPLEEKLQSSRYISFAVVYGDDRPYCVALVVLSREAVKGWAIDHGVDYLASYSQNEKIIALIQTEVDRINQGLSRFETIKRFAILDEDFTVENGLLTPTFKVKRKQVFSRYSEMIESLYKSSHANVT